MVRSNPPHRLKDGLSHFIHRHFPLVNLRAQTFDFDAHQHGHQSEIFVFFLHRDPVCELQPDPLGILVESLVFNSQTVDFGSKDMDTLSIVLILLYFLHQNQSLLVTLLGIAQQTVEFAG